MTSISIVDKYNSKRALGWSQDASDFDSLKNVVRLFDVTSNFHNELKNNIIQNVVNDKNLADHFVEVLNTLPLQIKYTDLVGTHSTPRSKSSCNGIVQAAVPGQVKAYLSDWAADSFVRWAHLLGFVKYDVVSDSFSITDDGIQYSTSVDGSLNEKEILIDAVLKYPPAGRILGLLSNGEVLTKFELGHNLGFVGEAGFTSLPQNILLSSLAMASPSERSKMLSDWDGSSDKYARQICKWLEKLGLVKTQSKSFLVREGNKSQIIEISQAYIITNAGLKAYRRVRGVNKVERMPKNVYLEMLCLKGQSRNYIRTRRGYLIKVMSETKTPFKAEAFAEKLKTYGFYDSPQTIEDDIKGLANIGLQIQKTELGYRLIDEIQNLILPRIAPEYEHRDFELLKEQCREYCKNVSHSYLDLIDLAFDSRSNRQFEIEVVDLLVSECGFEGLHLGGTRKPDGIIYTTGLKNNYGFIVDTKAYSGGYMLPISQADEMRRYVEENKSRDENINPNKWWEYFPSDINKFGFFFVSGSFQGSFDERLQNIILTTSINGSVVDVINLLHLAEDIKSDRYSIDQACNLFLSNKQIALATSY